jgi:hypothetical protein
VNSMAEFLERQKKELEGDGASSPEDD